MAESTESKSNSQHEKIPPTVFGGHTVEVVRPTRICSPLSLEVRLKPLPQNTIPIRL